MKCVLISSSRDCSLQQFWKKWTICLDYPGFSSEIELQFCYSCDWFYPAAGYELRLSRVPAAGYKLWLSRVLAARYKLRLTPSSGCLEFRRLDKGCGWLLPTADLCSGSWIRVTGHYILRLTRVPVAGYDLRLIPSCGWLRVATDSILQLTGVRRLDSTCGWPIL